MATYMLTGIDQDKWRRFKACCDLQGITIKDAFFELIDITIDELKNHPGPYKPRANKLKQGGESK